MNTFIKLLMLYVTLSMASIGAYAADAPSTAAGAEKFDKMACMDNNTQTCINSICLNSDQRDCQENCRKIANDKCEQLSKE